MLLLVVGLQLQVITSYFFLTFSLNTTFFLVYYTDVVVKCYLPSGEIRIIDVPLIQSIDDLKQKLLSEFSIEYVMRYKDEDGDMVLFHSDNDLRRAVINGNLKVHLIPLNDLTPQECESLEQIVNAVSFHVNFYFFCLILVLPMFLQVTVIDKKGNILFMNNRGLTLFGYSKDEVLGKNVRILMTKQDARHHQTYIKNYLETGFARIIGKDRVVQCLKADGNTFGARLVVTEKKDTSGRHIFTGFFLIKNFFKLLFVILCFFFKKRNIN